MGRASNSCSPPAAPTTPGHHIYCLIPGVTGSAAHAQDHTVRVGTACCTYIDGGAWLPARGEDPPGGASAASCTAQRPFPAPAEPALQRQGWTGSEPPGASVLAQGAANHSSPPHNPAHSAKPQEAVERSGPAGKTCMRMSSSSRGTQVSGKGCQSTLHTGHGQERDGVELAGFGQGSTCWASNPGAKQAYRGMVAAGPSWPPAGRKRRAACSCLHAKSR